MTEHAPIAASRDRRESATVTENYEVLPPEVYVDGDVADDLVRAVARAVAAEPNALTVPRVSERDDDYGEVAFSYSPNELPVVREGGNIDGWLPVYRAEEKIRAALREALPERWTLMSQRRGLLVFTVD